ncbi:DUF2970 domain-containing protein [Oceanospirillaceae bacterium]|nr:DUF2970 domain-containing protein [Oceanospirillaceae bacterium]MBT4998684.1 DUF2970 domain-containing protein [Oceanospirillaceae bacterium]MBT5630157.1 DUF2970 domain-containing protein [Oceanospirillaceae bacterium]MBT6102151.1 DUF2970 domain-containing protein [Oceanospirillaceae bacterium]MBT7673792.1 DUF2970 domain-containing protein [Oceanospirillaceae bacterium]
MSKQKSLLRTLLSFSQSVLASLVGIQSSQKREEDLEDGGLERMIYVGLGTLVVFLLIVVTAVNSALPD